MHLVDGRLLLSPTDLVGHLACQHLTQLELAAARGAIDRPERSDPELELLARKGEEHEAAQREELARGRRLVEIADRGDTLAGLAQAERDTQEAMRSGADVIYQATFFDGKWRGRADFLERVPTPSSLGSWSYEVADAKLARTVKVAALLQMCEYSHQLARLQGSAPESMHVILGTGERETHRVADYDAYFRSARARLTAIVDDDPQPTYPDPVRHCQVCTWRDVCDRRRRDDDHLSLVAGMRGDQVRRLVEAGIPSVAALAAATAPAASISDTAWQRLRQQAALQVEERTTGAPLYDLIDCDQGGLGLAALPLPSRGDLFFDMESDPFAEDGGLEYLFGITEVVDGRPCFTPFWGHDRAGERVAFERLVDLVTDRLARDPSLHVYHYSSYETSALKRLMSRHGTREDDVDRLLRGGIFVDLYQVVRQGVRVSRESYSLKQLEVFYMGTRTEDIGDAAASIVAYERWRDSGDQAELDAIAAYNERDCESTWRLRGWLEERRAEYEATRGCLPRPEPRTLEPSAAQVAASAETLALAAELMVDVPDQSGARTNEQQGRWLLANLLDWHRREARSEWWAYFDRLTKTDEQLVDDADSLGDIRHLGEVRREARSAVHAYAFDPAQEHKLDVGKSAVDPRTGRGAGTVVAIDNDSGSIELRRGPTLHEVPHPTSLIPSAPISQGIMVEALRRLARVVLDDGGDSGTEWQAARDLLVLRAPRIAGIEPGQPLVQPGEDPTQAAIRVVAGLGASYLPIQGPPGVGKTYTAAQVILDQVRRGCRVAVCATTHRAITELLTAVCNTATGAGTTLRVLQKCEEDAVCTSPGVRRAGNSEEVEQALRGREVDVVAGTPWLLARPAMAGQVDVVVIDEAGQMSLANALAVAGAGRNLVLLGDPQQLAQPSKGIHPPGAGVSALQHVLADHETVPPDRGVFLATTRRMHPEVCGFVSSSFYDGRLGADPACSAQRVNGSSAVAGTGLRLVPVEHSGNRTWSPEEVAAVRHLADSLLEMTWTGSDGVERPLGLDDILVVAPYNVAVSRLREHLPAGARVGTVDKFQGQEAAVAIFAMATSSAEDVPRNLEFLFNRNRLNVAVSRARAVAVIVCSPLLLEAGCRTPAQLRLVSTLCTFAESAEWIDRGGAE
ncbi:MAG: TM0106 family RecB-like putative nuclease [Candidatus Dormibacteria bacterium]